MEANLPCDTKPRFEAGCTQESGVGLRGATL